MSRKIASATPRELERSGKQRAAAVIAFIERLTVPSGSCKGLDDYEFASRSLLFRQEVDEALNERAIDGRGRARRFPKASITEQSPGELQNWLGEAEAAAMNFRFSLSDTAKAFVDTIVKEMRRPIAKAATAAICEAGEIARDGRASIAAAGHLSATRRQHASGGVHLS
jgi:hypothetical protein